MVGIIFGALLVSPAEAQQQNFDANYVLNDMTSDQQVSYISGVVHALAFARWLKDDKQTEGMDCVHAWWSGAEMWDEIDAFFGRHLDRQPVPLVYILVRAECGE